MPPIGASPIGGGWGAPPRGGGSGLNDGALTADTLGNRFRSLSDGALTTDTLTWSLLKVLADNALTTDFIVGHYAQGLVSEPTGIDPSLTSWWRFSMSGVLTVLTPPPIAPGPTTWKVTVAVNTIMGATTVPILPAAMPIPTGATLYTSTFTIGVTSPVSIGDTTLSTDPTPTALTSGTVLSGLPPTPSTPTPTQQGYSGSPPPQAGTPDDLVTTLRRVSILMPAPVLDGDGQPT